MFKLTQYMVSFVFTV